MKLRGDSLEVLLNYYRKHGCILLSFLLCLPFLIVIDYWLLVRVVAPHRTLLLVKTVAVRDRPIISVVQNRLKNIHKKERLSGSEGKS
jgi:hypothetical protein